MQQGDSLSETHLTPKHFFFLNLWTRWKWFHRSLPARLRSTGSLQTYWIWLNSYSVIKWRDFFFVCFCYCTYFVHFPALKTRAKAINEIIKSETSWFSTNVEADPKCKRTSDSNCLQFAWQQLQKRQRRGCYCSGHSVLLSRAPGVSYEKFILCWSLTQRSASLHPYRETLSFCSFVENVLKFYFNLAFIGRTKWIIMKSPVCK